ncbi:MAG: YqaJ viral recombinase family protein [Gallionella sp.]|nr:YqaJ viral recombinase family protein [Gallionella sp.]MDP1941254.1 YqaJ viral recombinase family protein [Gallionella sp.]
MKTVDLVQGTEAWKQHRAAHFNASDAPAMLGVSKYKTRAQLLKEMATGIIDEVDAHTQKIFDDGHLFEAFSRPLAEKIIGDDLSPVVGVREKLSASFDGITFDELTLFEHKTLNNSLRSVMCATDLDAQYRVQMEQQLYVSGAENCLFMATKWDKSEEPTKHFIKREDGTVIYYKLTEPAMHVLYESDAKLRAQIIAGWDQFAIDLANYQHVEDAPEVIAAPVMDLPALSIQVNGSISLISNLQKFGARLNEFVAKIDKEPSDDQGFADAESAIKTLQNAQDALEAAEANALAQTSDIDDMRKTVKLYADTARTTRLMLEKMVKARKESIRVEIVSKVNSDYFAHISALESEIKPIRLNAPNVDAATAIKGKKTIASLREAAGTALRNGKMEADALAADIRAKLSWCKESSSGYGFLFADLQTIITSNGMEAFQAIVQRRIDDHKAAEAAKLEAQRIEMQEAADKKAKAEADAIIAAERAKNEAEAKAAADAQAEVERQRVAAEVKAQMEAQAAQRAADQAAAQAERDAEAHAIEERRKAAQLAESAALQGKTLGKVVQFQSSRQSDKEIITAWAKASGISFGETCDLILEIAEGLRSAA